jgi:hypothetical protein
MIGKKVPSLGTGSKAGRITDLSSYITSAGHDEKCLASGFDGFMTDDLASRQAEMIALAESCKTSKDPIEHYIVSWPAHEIPTPEQAAEAVKIIQKEMGLEGLQMMWGLHQDTDNIHMHLMVNRVDPMTERARRINNGFDVDALQAAVAKVEHVQGWSVEANKRFAVVENGDVVRTFDGEKGPRLGQKQRDAERRTGEKSAVRIAQEQARPIIKEAQNWQELHQNLAEHGFRYEKKGSGAMLFVGDTPVKASDVNRDIALGQLQKRLGAYEPAPQGLEITRQIEPQPVNDVAASLGFREYSEQRNRYKTERIKAKAALDEKIKAEREALYKEQAAERKQALRGNWQGKGPALNAMRSVMAAEQAKAKAELMERQKEERRRFAQEFPPKFHDFEQWLSETKGKEAAQQYRYADLVAEAHGPDTGRKPHDIRSYQPDVAKDAVRYVNRDTGEIDFVDTGPKIQFLNRSDDAVLSGLQLSQQRYGKNLTLYGSDDFKDQAIRLAVANGITIANPELQERIKQERERQNAERMEKMKSEQARQFEIYHKALGADTYRTIARNKFDKKKVWYMDRQPDGTLPGFSPERIPWYDVTRKVNKQTEHLYFTPLSKSYHYVTVDDLTADKLKQMRAEGFDPADVQESSPGNLQAIVKIPRIELEPKPHLAAETKTLEYEASKELAKYLNSKYGDPEVKGTLQPSRMPGTPNVKDSHKQADGRYPTVKIIEASGEVCDRRDWLQAKMQELSRTKEQALGKDAGPKRGDYTPQAPTSSGEGKVYEAFRRDIEKKVLKGPATDASALDYMIAVRLRAVGYSPAQVAGIIESSTDRTGRAHTWPDYAKRTADAAFGPKGTQDMQRAGKYVEQWQKVKEKALTPPQSQQRQHVRERNSPGLSL